MSSEFAKALKLPDVLERFATMGLEPAGMSPEELAAFETKERAKWQRVVKEGNIKIE